jgi:repressor LexA
MSSAAHRRFEVLKVLARREAAREGTPTMRELARLVEGSQRGVAYQVGRLEEDGFIRVGDAPSRKVRPISLTERGWRAVGETPMLGRIAAGVGIDAIGQDDTYSLFGELLSGSVERFLLRAQGDSMIGAQISDGDMLVVEVDESPPDGSIVAALIENEVVTVKRLYRDGPMVRLRPENPAYEEQIHPAEDVIVQGRVVKVIHTPR